ncbi:uncharacterized protein N7473_009459 [Penicillium subrubescens]|uniref:Uncharacterized protein n=1 Tax=Penicillium subrubescens TaxID=1316194 RepID=A0A1Q5TB74_9EURO|nr:uncharacterized protein N7473_009459 [Penicillium subrubescens]KAJ5886785.1 hypothetical protein N7473_009459 [Penicillium subrubescens]OKO97458.1 hypothetical protein PENSUB_10252 [Penicillium subrubescens]
MPSTSAKSFITPYPKKPIRYNPRTGKTRFQMAEPPNVETETLRQTCLYFVIIRLPEEALQSYRIDRQVMTLIDDIIHARLRRAFACFMWQSAARWCTLS